MILKEMLEQLAGELKIETPKINKQKKFTLKINSQLILSLTELAPGFAIYCPICPLPKDQREDLLIHLMQANFLGQGTGGARIGLDADEKLLTLSHGFPYEMNYRPFKERVEDFANFAAYWRDVVEKYAASHR
jgi:hypothetical protein